MELPQLQSLLACAREFFFFERVHRSTAQLHFLMIASEALAR
jgi:hypothetical protein